MNKMTHLLTIKKQESKSFFGTNIFTPSAGYSRHYKFLKEKIIHIKHLKERKDLGHEHP